MKELKISLEQIREMRRDVNRVHRKASKLDSVRMVIMELHEDGASSREITIYLDLEHDISVNHSTVCRFIKRWIEKGI